MYLGSIDLLSEGYFDATIIEWDMMVPARRGLRCLGDYDVTMSLDMFISLGLLVKATLRIDCHAQRPRMSLFCCGSSDHALH